MLLILIDKRQKFNYWYRLIFNKETIIEHGDLRQTGYSCFRWTSRPSRKSLLWRWSRGNQFERKNQSYVNLVLQDGSIISSKSQGIKKSSTLAYQKTKWPCFLNCLSQVIISSPSGRNCQNYGTGHQSKWTKLSA